MPAKVWHDHYQQQVAENLNKREVAVCIRRPDGAHWTYRLSMLPAEASYQSFNYRCLERIVKFLLWAWGGNEVFIQGAPEVVAQLKADYSPEGTRAFDYRFMGQTCFLADFRVEAVNELADDAGKVSLEQSATRDLEGCRIGFDLGGSDRKCAALIDGEVVFTEEVKWDPYFQSDPSYHIAGIQDSLERAAKHLPRVDAIGGSAAGVYVNSEPRVASLFRGVSPEDFQLRIRPVFTELQKRWGDVPFVVHNDGDVTALAGAMSLGANGVLGVSMGTSQAVGYINDSGDITGWLNELAFAPVDYAFNAAVDEWSGDLGCGVQYFSQQAVARLIRPAGLDIAGDTSLPERLECVQNRMKLGDERAADIYRTLGIYFGYSIAHYCDFYDFKHLLFLGRVSSGQGGQILQAQAERVLADVYPELADRLTLSMPDEKMKRHGQAVAAASLPTLKTTV
ncbi:hypothetical protein [Cerasicoccus maritimus]|uniref:hypothetical protein n=1 Tax=Cerasicoccus maritimus TaxID=490089 RepID=UPI002852BAF0|nr:hypothetical protein [Cerasicoccus maritimus]